MIVGIGLVRRGEAFLVRQRPEGAALAGFWEFPGGKCQSGETPETAARRECFEETGLVLRAIALRSVVRHHYAHGRIELHFFDCQAYDPSAEANPATGFRWVEANALAFLRFPEANDEVVASLIREFGGTAEN
jgi:8-oxo-dGTP diphosphatase